MSDVQKPKKPSKSIRLSFLESQFAVLTANIPGFTEEMAKKSIQVGGHFVSSAELEDYKAKKESDKDFDLEGFVSFLERVEAIQEPTTSTRTGNAKSINGMDRVLEVCNPDADPEELKSLLDQLVALRGKINPMINTKAVLSLALKNKEEETEESGSIQEPVQG